MPVMTPRPHARIAAITGVLRAKDLLRALAAAGPPALSRSGFFFRARLRRCPHGLLPRLDRFRAVQLGGGERIRLRCKGRGCPFKAKRVKVRKAGSRDMTKLVRKARFRPGSVLEAFVTKPGAVGRYTKLRFRAKKRPVLRKRCVQPGAKKPSKCPPGA